MNDMPSYYHALQMLAEKQPALFPADFVPQTEQTIPYVSFSAKSGTGKTTYLEKLVACLKEGKKDTDACVDLLMVAKYLERIGDHAVNISEWEGFKETGSIKNERIL